MVLLFPNPEDSNLTTRYMRPAEVNAAFNICLDRYFEDRSLAETRASCWWWRGNFDGGDA